MEYEWHLSMVGLKKNWRVGRAFCAYLDLFFIIELYHLISKNQNLINCVLFIFTNLLKCIGDFNAQWHFFSEL